MHPDLERIIHLQQLEDVAEQARRTLADEPIRQQALAGVPIDLISTGPERDETIVRRHPFDPA